MLSAARSASVSSCWPANRMLAAVPASSRNHPQREYLLRVRDAAAAVTLTEAERSELKGPFLGERIRAKRLEAVSAVKDSSCPPERPSK